MSNQKNKKYNEIDSILKNILKPQELSLRETYENKLRELQITPTSALELLDIQYRTLKGILEGSQKILDFTNLIKVANFLQLPKEKVVTLYLEALEKNFPVNVITSDKVTFIKENFDLASLKKAGMISSINDFNEIENRIVSFFGLKSIFEYQRTDIHAAFSAGLIKPKNELNRFFWKKTANLIFEEIANPYEYDRKRLIEYFPKIRWHCTDVEFGLVSIIKDLFKLGITIIYQPSLPTLHLRGATLSVNDKPCIVLTNYVGFYPTLWFALIHELFHVLFDWEEIQSHTYHLSDEENYELALKEKEKEADAFAREYLISKEKMNYIGKYINNHQFVCEFAKNNNVHPSFIYVFDAYDRDKKTSGFAWARAHKFMPPIAKCIEKLDIPWTSGKTIYEIVKDKKYEIYN